MPNAPKTPHRTVRVDDELWTAFGDATTAAGTDRSTAIKQFMFWYLRWPSAKLPDRPGKRES